MDWDEWKAATRERNIVARRIAEAVTALYTENAPILWEQKRDTGDDLEALCNRFDVLQALVQSGIRQGLAL